MLKYFVEDLKFKINWASVFYLASVFYQATLN